ncbi:MAG: phosphate ABC transporter permease PstA [Candidatus Improbicoccus devescovinae]|nr:MAG: phosphate ABC transporter permease PstA [Candidatus Improbicoccus devescovinae]
MIKIKKIINNSSTFSQKIVAKKHVFLEFFLKFILYCASFIVFSIFLSIICYIFINGIHYLNIKFILNSYSEVIPELTGILPMLINTFYIIILTLILAVPLGIGTAIYLYQYAKNNILTKIIKISIDILSGIPSIIFGLFGYTIFCVFFGLGTSILAGCLTMVLCSIPIIIKTTEESLRIVPTHYIEGAGALGAKNIRILFTITLPTAIPGIITSIILAAGKILGESAALIYTAGMSYRMPKNWFSHIFESGRTLTLHLYQTAKQANTESSFRLSFASALLLLILAFLLNSILDLIAFLFKKNNR